MRKVKNIPENQNESKTPWLYYLSLPLRLCVWPFYVIYELLFEMPTKPSHLYGVIRFCVFIYLGLQLTPITDFVRDNLAIHKAPEWIFAVIMGVFSILMLIGMCLSFFQIFGSYNTMRGRLFIGSKDDENNSGGSGYSGIDDALEFRETLLNAKHTPDKIAELKRTGFITSGRIATMSQTPAVAEALHFMNVKMEATHGLGKYNLLKEMFGS